MGDRGEDVQQRSTGRSRIPVTAEKDWALMVRAVPGEKPGPPLSSASMQGFSNGWQLKPLHNIS